MFFSGCNHIDTPTISNLNSEDGESRLCINKKAISLCVDLKRGGCFDELHINNGPNIVDNPIDGGRQIQVSLYDGQTYYDSVDCWRGKWGWNPVQCGDRYGHGSRVLNFNYSMNRIETVTKPLQWAGNESGEAIEADVIIFQIIEILDNQKILINYKVIHEAEDSHTGATHEFPCMYFKNFILKPVIIANGNSFAVNYNTQWFRTNQIILTTDNGISGIKFTSSGDFYTAMMRNGVIEPGLVIQNWKRFDFVGKSELRGWIILEFF